MIQYCHYVYHRIHRLCFSILSAIVCLLFVFPALLMLSSCTAYETYNAHETYDNAGDSTLVKLTVALPIDSHANDSVASTKNLSSTRSISLSNEASVNNLAVMIFDSSGDLIGYNYDSKPVASGSSVNVYVKTRKSTNCTVYVVANAGTESLSAVAVHKIADFEQLYASITQASSLDDGSSLPMFGKLTGMSTMSPGTVRLSRISSKIEMSISLANGITLDSYQLCSVPLSAYYADTKKARTLSPAGYANYPAVENTTSATSFSRTFYLFESLVGKGKNDKSLGWKGRYAAMAPDNATYLLIKAHTSAWKSTYRVYLGGQNFSSDTNTDYDYSDYSIYRNSYYKIVVKIESSGVNEDNMRVDYYMTMKVNNNNLSNWGNESTGNDNRIRTSDNALQGWNGENTGNDNRVNTSDNSLQGWTANSSTVNL